MLQYISKKAGVTGQNGQKWALVVDFCAYLRKEIKSAIRGLSGLLNLYVFISTDSIYDVCEVAVRKGAIRETDDLRPSDDKVIKEKAKDEDYGHDKLKCEEYLRSHVLDLEEGFPFLCLRLPDVIGPYDSTCRFWAYLTWLNDMARKPIHTQEESREAKLSFVYSKDVAALCVSLVDQANDSEFVKKVHGQSFNIGFTETPTLDQFITLIVRPI
jgi:nucleoside-diphosphate-sugar epimerase